MPLPLSPIGFDASVLINFFEVKRLDIIVQVCAPPRWILLDVLVELEGPCEQEVTERIQGGEFTLTELSGPHELEQWARYTRRLDAGESATLAASVSRGWSIALDDEAARRLAEQELGEGRITGTVGLLRAAVEARVITLDEGNRLLKTMIEAGYWSPVKRLDEK
jgi:predicted nucleic acid-binding protein